MELTPGYKRTEAGVIPEDWLEHTIGELIEFEGGSQPDKSYFRASWKRGYVRLIQIRDYKTDKYETYVPTHLARRFCTEHDIMIGRYGPPVFQILRGIDGAYNVALIKAKPGPGINGSYMYYFLKQDKLFSFIEKLSQRSSGQTGVDLKELRQYALPLPPTKAEQEAIAEALSDTDALIESLEQLITKKRHLKQGAMKELLTVKKRLPGFSGEWEVKRLGELFEITSSKRVFQSEWTTRGIPFYRARELAVLGEQGFVDNELFITKEMYTSHKKAYGVPAIGDFLVTGVGTLGKVYAVEDEREFYFKDGNIIWFKCAGKISSEFLKQLYSTPLIIKQIEDGSEGTTVGTYTITNAKNTIIPFPPIPEQTAIATILSSMDAEITTLETKLAKTRQLKQGMMHNLLTGRIRLI